MTYESKAHRFGWVDWGILLLLCAVVFVGVYVWRIGKNQNGEMAELVYVLCVPDLNEREGTQALSEEGSIVMNQNGTQELGKVIAKESRPVQRAVVSNGAVVFVAVPNKQELLIWVQATASQKEGDGFRVGDIRIAVGKRGDFRVGGLFASNASIVRVEEAQS